MESQPDYWTAAAMLAWQVEAGADEAILDMPVNRYDLEAQPAKPKPKQPVAEDRDVAPAVAPPAKVDELAVAVAAAEAAANAAATLVDLRAALDAFPHCELKQGARQTVFADGNAAAPVMIIGEAPGRDEDREGRPFVGRAGQLLDRMLGAIQMDRSSDDPASAVYITNVLPWRPPGNRAPDASEIAMLLPFLNRHIALADPKVIVLMGNTPCQAILGRTGITRMRGGWTDYEGRPLLPMFHPAYLLRTPIAKREAWADLLSLRQKLGALSAT